MNNKNVKTKSVKKILNKMSLEISAKSENESFARGTVAAFASQVDPTLEEIDDIKTAVSEAVTNCVVHAYRGCQSKDDKIKIECVLYNDEIEINVADIGIGIADIEKAMEPFYTTANGGERSGMGFTVMQSFTDYLSVNNNPQGGTVVTMRKFFTKEERKVSGA
jgi:stage II sporulation protein AB (anti-sigma F factor)